MSVLEKACPLMISMQPDKSRIVLQRRTGEKLQWPDVETDREVQHTYKLKAQADSDVVHAKQTKF